MPHRRSETWTAAAIGLVLAVLAGAIWLGARRSVAPTTLQAPSAEERNHGRRAEAAWSDNRVIFGPATARKVWPGLADRSGDWTPTVADVRALEARLPGYLKVAVETDPFRESYAEPDVPPLWTRVLSYKRQYAGILDRRRRIIFGSFFCEELQRDWHKEDVDVMGGGDCFFRVKYDVEAGRLFDLDINAPK